MGISFGNFLIIKPTFVDYPRISNFKNSWRGKFNLTKIDSGNMTTWFKSFFEKANQLKRVFYQNDPKIYMDKYCTHQYHREVLWIQADRRNQTHQADQYKLLHLNRDCWRMFAHL